MIYDAPVCKNTTTIHTTQCVFVLKIATGNRLMEQILSLASVKGRFYFASDEQKVKSMK